MNEQNHPWCRDVSRDEAIRAVEDEAAQWRRLEVGEVIEDGDEFLSAMDGQWRRTAATGTPAVGSIAYRRRRVPLPDHRDLPQAVKELRERVARLEDHFADASKMVAPPQPAPVTPADGLRTERVTLEITHKWVVPAAEGAADAIKDVFRYAGESVRVVEEATVGSGDVFADVGCGSTGDEIVRLTAELEAAREECKRRLTMCEFMQRQRDAAKFNVSCLKARVAELEAAPAANAGGEVE